MPHLVPALKHLFYLALSYPFCFQQGSYDYQVQQPSAPLTTTIVSTITRTWAAAAPTPVVRYGQLSTVRSLARVLTAPPPVDVNNRRRVPRQVPREPRQLDYGLKVPTYNAGLSADPLEQSTEGELIIIFRVKIHICFIIKCYTSKNNYLYLRWPEMYIGVK